MQYDLNYYEHTLIKMSATAEDICKRRWDFIECAKAVRILDYGCGVGWFRAFRPKDNLVVDSYDISPICPQTGINEMRYDLVCFWDSMEHIPNLKDIEWLLYQVEYVAISIPIKPDNVPMKSWKHYRPPDEHIHYFTIQSLNEFFAKYGFSCVKQNQCECPPRVDVWTLLYRKNK